VLLRYRLSRTIGHGRPAAFLALMVLWPFAGHMPALAALSFAAAIFVGLIAYEAIRYRETRAYIRHGATPTEELMTGQQVPGT
jgi:hypothetical protein